MKMAFTPTTVNNWFFTIDGLSAANGNDQPVPQPFLGQYVTELNPVPPATTPVATPAEIQANLENFPFNPGTPPPTNLVTDTFYRTTVADFVLREFQLAWGMVPTSGPATSQYDAWVARVIDNPANMTAGGMSMALAGTPNFTLSIGAVSATQPATIGMINALAANAGVAVGAGAQALVGLPVWQVLQAFATSTLVTNAMAAPIANFQNLLLAGGTAPAGNLLTLPGSSGANLNLTTGVDTQTTGFTGGHGATATQAGAVFNAQPGTNVLGLSNTLNAGDNLVATGAAIGNSTLNYTAINQALGGNPALASGVTMTGVSAAVITDNSTAAAGAGFNGNITGLTTVTLTSLGTPGGFVNLGTVGPGLNTALTTVNINASQTLTADFTAAALAAAPSATINVSGGLGGAGLALNPVGVTAGYSALTINSAGPGGTTDNVLGLFTTATNTATITVSGAEALVFAGAGSGTYALNIDNLHTFTGASTTTPGGVDTGGITAFFANADGLGHVAVTGGSGVNTFEFGDVAATGGASFNATSAATTSTVNGGTGATNTLIIDATTGPILLPGVGANISGIATVEHSTGGVLQTGDLTADLTQLGSATTFDLAGDYGAFTTTVSNISTQTVEYSGTSVAGSDLLLVALPPVTATSVINFEMNSSVAVPALTLNELSVAAGLKAVDIDSTGLATNNVITETFNINDNINVTGATHLTLGEVGFAYQLATGVIDASGTAAGGGVTAFLFSTPGSATAQTFLAGPTGTTNDAEFTNSGGGLANFTLNGADTVGFHVGTAGSGNPINDAGHNYNDVLASATVAPIINISTGGIPTTYTDTGAVVAAGDPTTAFNFATGGSVTATGHNNLIDITTTTNAAPAGSTVAGAFALAVGGPAAGITVGTAGNVLLSFYDATTSQAVLADATPTLVAGNEVINNASAITVVGLIHETAAQYGTIASQLHFVA
jgi:hypothetical protein